MYTFRSPRRISLKLNDRGIDHAREIRRAWLRGEFENIPRFDNYKLSKVFFKTIYHRGFCRVAPGAPQTSAEGRRLNI